ncbi:MAG: FMN-binding protein [Oscillospiraceae bacterium]|nr:FMN-binding protein [Oscillospiraceae bacterium]
MKKAVVIILAAIIVLAGASLILKNMVSEAAKDISISDIDTENVRNGVYTGEHSVPPVSVTVQVTVTDHRIADIEILRHDNGLGSKAEKITDEIIGKQSLNVDAVSGATLSSVCILKAVENAVEKNTYNTEEQK